LDTTNLKEKLGMDDRHPILIADDSVSVEEFRLFVQTLNPWLYEPQTALTTQQRSDASFIALQIARREPKLKQYEQAVINAIEQTLSIRPYLKWIKVGQQYSVKQWITKGCDHFMQNDACWRLDELTSAELSFETIAKLYHIKERINSAAATDSDAPKCYRCGTQANYKKIVDVSVYSRTCQCGRVICVVGYDRQTYAEDVVKELVGELFFETPKDPRGHSQVPQGVNNLVRKKITKRKLQVECEDETDGVGILKRTRIGRSYAGTDANDAKPQKRKSITS
jgi:hypothetical protein